MKTIAEECEQVIDDLDSGEPVRYALLEQAFYRGVIVLHNRVLDILLMPEQDKMKAYRVIHDDLQDYMNSL